MKKELIRLLKAVEDTVPPYEMKRTVEITVNSRMNDECRALFDHLMKYEVIVIKADRFGLECIDGTDIRVLRGMIRAPYIESRYGNLVIPVRTRYI